MGGKERSEKDWSREEANNNSTPETGIGIIGNELKIDDTFVVHFFPL